MVKCFILRFTFRQQFIHFNVFKLFLFLIEQNRTKYLAEMIDSSNTVGSGFILNFVENYLIFCNILYLKLNATMIIFIKDMQWRVLYGLYKLD